jgi:hypothetical protein
MIVPHQRSRLSHAADNKHDRPTGTQLDWQSQLRTTNVPPMANPNIEITATDFERLVRDWILKKGGELTSLEVTHDVKVEAYDSTYQIDLDDV